MASRLPRGAAKNRKGRAQAAVASPHKGRLDRRQSGSKVAVADVKTATAAEGLGPLSRAFRFSAPRIRKQQGNGGYMTALLRDDTNNRQANGLCGFRIVHEANGVFHPVKTSHTCFFGVDSGTEIDRRPYAVRGKGVWFFSGFLP